MSTSKDIRSQIGSIKKTQKITRAMELVAASKMRKAQDRMALSRPYAQKILQVIGHIANSHSEYRHPYFDIRPVRRVGLIMVSTDRGLCGGLNLNLFKKTLAKMRDWQKDNIEIDSCLIGNKATAYFRRLHSQIVGQATHLGDAPTVADIVGVVKVMLDKFENGEIDALYIASNEFINTMKQQPKVEQLLPLPSAVHELSGQHHWDYIYEPESKTIIDILMRRYIESQVYQGVVENIACEQASRMVAMKSATDNAGTLMEELRLAYNKARQAAITREIAEIVSGGDAVA
ncbi:MAG: F0F1 ATP synthase subunit gamma [Legionellales bacterium]|nr:F0F1 ATP synthase subunit gamma [Legionellales bacterium]